MTIKKTLTSLVLAGAMALGLAGKANSDIILTLNKPVETYELIWNPSEWKWEEVKIPDTKYLYENNRLKTGVHVYNDMGINEDNTDVCIVLDYSPESRKTLNAFIEKIYPNNIEADYGVVMDVMDTEHMPPGYLELTVNAVGNSGFSDSVSLGYYHINEEIPEPSTLSLLAIGGLTGAGLYTISRRKRDKNLD